MFLPVSYSTYIPVSEAEAAAMGMTRSGLNIVRLIEAEVFSNATVPTTDDRSQRRLPQGVYERSLEGTAPARRVRKRFEEGEFEVPVTSWCHSRWVQRRYEMPNGEIRIETVPRISNRVLSYWRQLRDEVDGSGVSETDVNTYDANAEEHLEASKEPRSPSAKAAWNEDTSNENTSNEDISNEDDPMKISRCKMQLHLQHLQHPPVSPVRVR
jgi:hypothetical protein